MMFIISAILGIALGVAMGGRIANLLDFHVKKSWIILLAFVLMTVTRVLGLNYPVINDYNIIIHILVYTLLLICLFFNRHYWGVWAIGIGCFLNAIVMLLNNGKMPVSAECAAKAGISVQSVNADIKHIIFYKWAEIKLAFLSDIIFIPGVPGIGMRIASIGDLIVAFGLFIIMFEMVKIKKVAGKIETKC